MPSRLLFIGIVVGFCVSIAVLTLMWFGVAGVLNVGHTNLMYLFWPSSRLLTVSWRSTLFGMATTIVSVAINCVLYMAIAYGLSRIVRTVSRSMMS
jgi:ABC-type Fe3+ transport system permease subunit